MMMVDKREVVDASTFHNVAQTPVTLMQFLTAVPREVCRNPHRSSSSSLSLEEPWLSFKRQDLSRQAWEG